MIEFNIDISKYEYPHLKPLQQDWRWCHKYAYDIVKGNIPACKKMKLTAQRHFRDLQRDDIYFDDEAANSIVSWSKFCPIIKGAKAGSPTILDPSQIFMVASLIAWKWSDDVFEIDGATGQQMQTRFKGKRRFNQFYAQVSRKYGKTTLIAIVLLYLMHKYKHGPRVYSLATKKDQAKEVWNVAKKMINLSPRLKTIFHTRANDILLPAKEGEFKPLASDSNSLDGLDLIAGCLDECHAIKDRNLYGVLVSAFGGNEDGEYLFAVITTAGFILDGLCTDLYKNGERVLNGDIEQDNYFYCIYEIDKKVKSSKGVKAVKGDDWKDERSWYKSNPALVYGRPSLQYLRDRYKEATLSVEEKGNFLTKHCNLFVSGADKWLDIDAVKECTYDLDFDEWKEHECYVGLDRALVSDITSFSIGFPTDDGGFAVFFRNLQSKGAIDGANDYLKSIYMRADATGDVDVLIGQAVRDEHVKSLIRELWSELPNCKGFYYDPWHMKEVALDMEDEGIPMIAVSQGTGNMSEPAKKLESLIADGLFVYTNSVLFEYACACAMTSVTRQGNMQVYRDPNNSKVDKIDPLIATIIALSGATLIKQETSIYDKRGIIML